MLKSSSASLVDLLSLGRSFRSTAVLGLTRSVSTPPLTLLLLGKIADPRVPFFGKFTQVLQQAGELDHCRLSMNEYLLNIGCPVDNKAPKIISQNPHEGGMFVGIKKGLSAACREAYMQTKADPQIIFCILEVSSQRGIAGWLTWCRRRTLHSIRS